MEMEFAIQTLIVKVITLMKEIVLLALLVISQIVLEDALPMIPTEILSVTIHLPTSIALNTTMMLELALPLSQSPLDPLLAQLDTLEIALEFAKTKISLEMDNAMMELLEHFSIAMLSTVMVEIVFAFPQVEEELLVA